MQKSADAYRPIQSLESKVLMHDLRKRFLKPFEIVADVLAVHTPKKFRKHLERYAASVIVTITYGRRVTDVDNDKHVVYNAKAMETLTHVNVPGRYAVESFPFLKHVPTLFAPWKQYVIEQKKIDQAMYLELMNDVKEKMKNGGAPPSFAKDLLEKQATNGMGELEIAYAASTPFGVRIIRSAISPRTDLNGRLALRLLQAHWPASSSPVPSLGQNSFHKHSTLASSKERMFKLIRRQG